MKKILFIFGLLLPMNVYASDFTCDIYDNSGKYINSDVVDTATAFEAYKIIISKTDKKYYVICYPKTKKNI